MEYLEGCLKLRNARKCMAQPAVGAKTPPVKETLFSNVSFVANRTTSSPLIICGLCCGGNLMLQ